MPRNNKVIEYEEKLWQAVDKLRGSMDSSEYKYVVLGLIFLKYVSEAFEIKYQELVKCKYANAEEKDEYTSENIFWVPKIARWSEVLRYVNTAEIGMVIDNAMDLIEKENPSLKGVLKKDYARPELDKNTLSQLVTLFTQLEVGADKAQEMEMLGRVYEYFLSKFAAAEGKGGGEFYTPTCIVRTLVEMIEPFKGKVYDPCCGSGGMFVQSSKFIKENQGSLNDVSLFGQEINPTTWKLAKMNLAIRKIDGNLGKHNADSFHEDLHETLRADYILANPPFNISDWGGAKLQKDIRWQYGVPPIGNANYAWLQHMLYHLSPENGVAATVLANGSLSNEALNEGEIRKNMIEDDVVEAIVAMPSNLSYATSIPCCLWIMRKTKNENTSNKILFIDARSFGKMVDRKLKILSDKEIKKIADTYHNWRKNENYENIMGFCKSVSKQAVRKNDYILTPGRYVEAKNSEDNEISFEEKMLDLTEKIGNQMQESAKLEQEIKKILGAIGYEI